MARGLTDRVGRPLEPVRVVGRLLGGEDLDEPLTEEIHPVGLRDVPVERRRVELREDEDAPDIRVQAVAHWNINQPVLASDRNGWFRAMLGERKEAGASAAAENQRERLVVHGHTGPGPCRFKYHLTRG